MAVKTVERYRTSDGELFTNAHEADKHEAELDHQRLLKIAIGRLGTFAATLDDDPNNKTERYKTDRHHFKYFIDQLADWMVRDGIFDESECHCHEE